MESDLVEISVVIPLYNESENIEHLFQRLRLTLETLKINYEIICVNDGSKDNTLEKSIKFNQQKQTIKVINLSRNFGKEIALTTGLDCAIGAAIIPINADLQDPPELIGELISKWSEG